MPLVLDTYNDYVFYLQYKKGVAPATVKANKHALQYFSGLYGDMDTTELLSLHILRFHEVLLQKKRQQKNAKGEYDYLSKYSVYKIMVKIKAYIKRLEDEKLL